MLLFAQRLVRHGAADHVDKLDRVVLPHAVDGRGDLRGVALLAVFKQDLLQLGARPVVHHVVGRKGLAAVHAHIERRVGHVGKAARAVVQLRAGNAKVEQNAVHSVQPKAFQNGGDIFKIVVDERHLCKVAL